MLPKTMRFSRVTFPKKGAKSRHQFSWGGISLYEANASQGAVVVSKKVAPKAHDRNRIRRRVYAALQEVLKDKKLVCVVIFPRREALTTEFKVMVEDISNTVTSK